MQGSCPEVGRYQLPIAWSAQLKLLGPVGVMWYPVMGRISRMDSHVAWLRAILHLPLFLRG